MADSDRQAVLELIRETPLQLLEIQQHVAPTHQRGAEDGSSHAKPSSRPPLAIDPIDAMQAETRQIIYWSNTFGFGVRNDGWPTIVRGTIGQRIEFLNRTDIPDWDIDNILERWMPIRNTNRKLWPTGYERTWVSEIEAVAWVGKNLRTLQRWRALYPAIAATRDGETMYHLGKLSEAKRVMELAAKESIANLNAQVAPAVA